ncbi:unnamed protein product [Schistosoma mattheei]|uniref:Uncharacterized protein n=1 Tax=Schistosoma mattheei TaxID=31246 RepID=A0A3P7YVJ4_9TREM|nr:unnamed protein product [Schistosoma mattheei]
MSTLFLLLNLVNHLLATGIVMRKILVSKMKM